MPPNDYLDNQLLHDAIVKSQRAGKPTDALASMLLMMAEGIMSTKRFSGYSYQDDLVSVAVLRGLQKYALYTPANGNAFNWYTTVMKNAALNYIRSENGQARIARKYWREVIPDHLPDMFD